VDNFARDIVCSRACVLLDVGVRQFVARRFAARALRSLTARARSRTRQAAKSRGYPPLFQWDSDYFNLGKSEGDNHV